MSTLPGLASKGEKEKAKYQVLDINKLYRVSLGESSENKQQKSTLSQKHGMQSLGKVPNTRRPPANLPSLKSEHSGTDTAVSLVPSNGSGWGKQESTVQTSTTTTVQATSNNVNANAPIAIAGPALSAHQAAIALPVTTTIQPAGSAGVGGKQPPPQHPQSSASPATNLDKSWSSVMIGSDPNAAHPPPYQSPQFQHEFPSLSAGDGGQPRAATDTGGYAPGLSLRPQTEGSWLQGGGARVPADSSAVPGVGAQHSAPGGPPLPPQVRGFVPNFMYRAGGGNYPANGHGGAAMLQQQQQQQHTQQAPARSRQDPRHRGGSNDPEELAHRPIIKEEDLSGMDNLTGDMGWAINDDIDYNQKLAFSDDELKEAKDMRRSMRDKTDTHLMENDQKPQQKPQPRSRHEEDEFSAQRRRQQQEIAHAVERAKQRKEEEEKKFLETRQAAAKKLQELNERIDKSKRDKDVDDNCGTINPASVPPQTIAPVPILLPEWEREKEVVVVMRPKPDAEDLKHKTSTSTDFKHLTQIEGRANFGRKDSRTERSVEKEQPSGGATQTTQHSSFSKQFQNDLPPRFQRQQQLNAQSSFQYDNRWSQGGSRTSPSNRKSRDDDKDPEDRYRRQDDNYRSQVSHRYDSSRKSYEDYDFKPKEDEKMRRDVRRGDDKESNFDGMTISRQSSDEWHGDKRPQRPDSRDSRTSRESRDSARHSEPREYTSWAEEPIEEKKKEHRMVVPGPITKEKIEADDLRSEKRNLTQLKRGAMGDQSLNKKLEKPEDDNDSWSIMKKDSIDEPKAWADSIPPAVEKELLKAGMLMKDEKRDEEDEKNKEDKKRGRSDSQGSRNQGWSGNVQVYRNSWSNNKKNTAPLPRNPRGGVGGGAGGLRTKGQDMTESEGSADDQVMLENGPSPKSSKKLEKDERNKEARSTEKQQPLDRDNRDRGKMDKNHFVPRGEPSRHGRGASLSGSSFRGSRGGSKRVDTYGPPAKSPFSNIDEKDRKHDDAPEDKSEDKNRKKIDPRKKPKQDGDVSDNSDVDGRKSKNSQRSGSMQGMSRARGGGGSGGGGGNTAPRQMPPVDKRGFGGPHRQNANIGGNLPSSRNLSSKDKDGKDKDNTLSSAIADITLKEVEILDGEVVDDGFQEVKSKKTDRSDRKIVEKKEEKPKMSGGIISKPEKDIKKPSDRSVKMGPSPQQVSNIANIPSLMATPINPPPNMPQTQSQSQNKGQFDRNRQNKTLPPRFAKAKEHNRMQKAQMQQGICDDIKINNPNHMYGGLKDGLHVGSTSINSNAWDKPLSQQMRVDQNHDLVVGMECKATLEAALHHPGASDDKTVLDGSKPLTTIIFENTNYKSAPGARGGNRNDKQRKMEDGMDGIPYNKPIGDLLGKDKTDIQLQLFNNKEDSADMKLDFLESEISQITEEKSSKMSLSRSNMNTSNNILTADALNMKIQSVKKVWENIPNVMDVNDDSFASSFVTDSSTMDANTAFSKGSEVPDDNHDVYNSSPNATNSTTNVCKVKPTQQVAGGGGQVGGGHQPHSNIVGPALMGHALSSPPPIQPVMGGLGQPPQQYTASGHISYQTGLGSNQYGGIPAPSPPNVLNYSTQPLQQTGLYAPFQLDTSQVMNNQGRSQYSQYSFGLGQTGSSPYSQSMYLPTAQPHAPPNQQPDLYQNMNNYRMPNTGPFGQNQQLNNPTTVLISSTSNSLMSPSVKPSNQQISAIGTKAGGVGQAYQQQSQQGQQVYIPFDPTITANYMQTAGVIQRGPGVQNNVVPGLQPSGLQPSSSFYSGSTGGQTGYFQGPGSSSLPSQMQQHQAGFGLQQSVFPTHNQSHTNAGMQNYPTPYLSGQQMQLAAAAMSQYRSASIQNPQFMKNQIGDQGRQQLKSPGSQQEVLSSVFNSGSQIASPKSRQQMKQPPPQPSPTAHSKYMYGGMSSQQGGQQTRYPTPIQRPAGNYQSQMSNVQNNSGNPNQKPHRMNNNSNNRSSGGGGGRYYGSQGGNMNTQSDKAEESKLNDGGVNSSNQSSSGSSKPPASVSQPNDKPDVKEENCAKD
ncbi:protein PRRC2C-like isoform X2 [Atheta coriaria]|uniref:protein PRRC2C-like isoform X2 n=1 Tax=Dalotia coriaria TaxID=877792 RepID=UPI0031F3BCA6